MTKQFSFETKSEEFHPIIHIVSSVVTDSGCQNRICIVYSSHTTAGITINENADPDVVLDLLFALKKTFPDRKEFRHLEGNSAAHLKTSCTGNSVVIPIQNGSLFLSRWQRIYFCEFDGPRHRNFTVTVVNG